MPSRLISLFGILLVFVGVGGYVLSNQVSLTALIPAVFGVLLLGANELARRLRHNTVVRGCLIALAALGVVLPQRGLLGFFSTILTGRFQFPLVTLSQAFMGLLCFAVLVTAIIQWQSSKTSRSSNPKGQR